MLNIPKTVELVLLLLDWLTLVMRIGAVLPGMRAVDMTMSTSLHCLANRAISAAMNSLDITLP